MFQATRALGGLLIRADLFGLGWRVVFLVNIPIGLAAVGADIERVGDG